MNVIDFFIKNPVKVAVGVLLLVLFGLLTVVPPSILPSPIRVPVQLTPNMDEPVVSVTTLWEGASPEEVEREIIDPQEEVLKSVTGLKKLTSAASQGSGAITLEFVVGTNQDVAKQDVSDALRRVKYQIPLNEFENPIVISGRPFGQEAIAWMILSSEAPDVSVPSMKTFVDDNVKSVLERVEGIASIGVYGGREREVQVVADPWRLAQAGITFNELAQALTSQNTNVSAGASSQGKRDIVIRTMGQFTSLEEVRQTVIKTGPGGPIRVGDVAEVRDDFKKQYEFVRSKGREVIALAAYRETNANVIETMEGLREAVAGVNREVLAPRGLDLELTNVYDQTVYIHSAIGLVKDNIYFGGALAVVVLWLFLRSWSATGIVALAIPISVIGTFLVIPLADRTVNVVMLAGLAFAVGMVVDNAIVVLENIYRHMEMGKPREQAALEGSAEVWGAVLANSLTTAIVFLPIIFVKEEAGQLFRDIAIAISAAVLLSLVVSLTVIPPLAARYLVSSRAKAREEGGRIAHALGRFVGWINGRVGTRLAVVLIATFGSVWLSMRLAPEPSYLPSGNQNLIFGFLITPPGYNAQEFRQIGISLEEGDPAKGQIGIRPFWEAEPGSEQYAKLLSDWNTMVEKFVVPGKQAEIASQEAILKDGKSDRRERADARARIRELRRDIALWRTPPPPIDNFFYVSFGGQAIMGCSSKDPGNVRPLLNVLNSTGFSIPDSFAIFFQTSIFTNLGESNSVEVEVRGDDLDRVTAAAGNIAMACRERFGNMPESTPRNFQLGRREDRLVPDRVRAGEVGLNVADIGSIVRACGDGRVVGQYREGGDSVDLTIKFAGLDDPDQARGATSRITETPVFTPSGRIVPLSSVCRLERTTAPQEIDHIETQRSVKLTIRPPEGMALPEVINTIQDEIVAPMRASGYGPQQLKIEPGIIVSLAGNADKLRTTWDALKWLLLLSFLICYLLMAGLFESFAYPFVIIFTVPFAVIGGFIGLALVNQWTWSNPSLAVQQLDMLTILGFVILLGIVVNNGILIVHQSLNYMSYGRTAQAAIVESVQSRLRPILMTVMTTFFGQLPLVIRPGSGAELYRGLGAVVLGGLLVSTLFTLIVVPAVLSLFLGARLHLSRALFGRRARQTGGEIALAAAGSAPFSIQEGTPSFVGATAGASVQSAPAMESDDEPQPLAASPRQG